MKKKLYMTLGGVTAFASLFFYRPVITLQKVLVVMIHTFNMKKRLTSFVVAGMLSLVIPTSADILDWRNLSVNYSQNSVGSGSARIYHDYFGETGIDRGDTVMVSANPNNQFFVTYDEVESQKLKIDRRNWNDGIGAMYKSTLSFENKLNSAIDNVENNVSFLNLNIER